MERLCILRFRNIGYRMSVPTGERDENATVSLGMYSSLPFVNGQPLTDTCRRSQTLLTPTGSMHPIRSANFLLGVTILLGRVLPFDTLTEQLTDGPLSRWRWSPQYSPWPMETLAPKPCMVTSTFGCEVEGERSDYPHAMEIGH